MATLDDVAVGRKARRKLTGYWLILPGAVWLGAVLRRAVLLAALVEPVRPGGIGAHRLLDDVALPELRRRLRRALGHAVAVAVVRRRRHTHLPGDRLRAGLRDRVQVRALEEPHADPGDRPVLHQLPAAHAVVEADPGRRRLHREHAAVRQPPRSRRPPARDRRSRSSPGSPTTSCRSWCCRCTRASRRSTSG